MMPEPDDELFDELRSVLRRTDPVPAEVTDFAKAALGWRRLDAELAELLDDSVLDEAAALTRGGGSRSLTFRTDDLTIDVEIQDGHLLGQLAPPASASVALEREDGEPAATADADVLGRFRLELGGEGRFRLRVVPGSGRAVETSWFSL